MIAPKVTESDRHKARLIAGGNVEEIAQALAEFRSEVLSCLMVRAERTFEKARQPGLPFDAPQERGGK